MVKLLSSRDGILHRAYEDDASEVLSGSDLWATVKKQHPNTNYFRRLEVWKNNDSNVEEWALFKIPEEFYKPGYVGEGYMLAVTLELHGRVAAKFRPRDLEGGWPEHAVFEHGDFGMQLGRIMGDWDPKTVTWNNKPPIQNVTETLTLHLRLHGIMVENGHGTGYIYWDAALPSRVLKYMAYVMPGQPGLAHGLAFKGMAYCGVEGITGVKNIGWGGLTGNGISLVKYYVQYF